MLLRRSSWFLVLMALGGLGGAVACSTPDESALVPLGGTGSTGSAVLADNAEMLPQEAANAVIVEEGRLLFPASYTRLLLKKPGDILLGERQQRGVVSGNNPQGFFRKVVSVQRQGGHIVVLTEPASLTEAFQQLHFEASIQGPTLTAEGPAGELNPDGLGYLPQGKGKPIEIFNFSGKSLFDVKEGVQVGGKNVGFHAFAKVDTGFLKFTPSYDIKADVTPPKFGLDGISLPKLNSFKASATGALDAQLVMHLGLKLDSELDSATFTQLVAQKIFKAKDANLADYNLDLGSVKAGPISIPINVQFTAVLSCDFVWTGGAEVKYGGKANASITAGLKYESEQIFPIFEKSASFEQIGPNWTLDGLVRVKCAIAPTLQLKLWDLGSAQIWSKAYAGIAGSLTCGEPSGDPPKQTGQVKGEALAGVRAGIKANLNLLGLVKYNKECTLFDLQSPKASFTQSFSLPSGPKASCEGGDLPFQLEEPPAPEKCFGSGGSGDGSGGANGTETGGGCKEGFNDVAAGWTCDVKQWNDCKCDCNCGVKDIDCKDGECSSCSHDECTVGEPLGNSCSPCTEKVCAQDPYCCEEKWGPSCFVTVEQVCGKKCSN
ncbi:MAG: hypothetical protein RMJ98_05095, partial [Myxococcales bacterium]|nr:hypothetical protein [Polyangiaceae bacterium]MDW8248665.1 hypothetical protein [Myxococcales bacterium]